MNTQKRNIFLILAILVGNFFLIQAQTTSPLKPLAELDEDFILDNNLYVKDVDNVLGQFLGTWTTTTNGKTYEFKIDRHIDNSVYFEYKIDILVMRYFIKEDSKILDDTRSISLDHDLLIYGMDYIPTNRYRFTYTGRDFDCGQVGDVIIRKINSDSMKLVLIPDNILLDTETCPNGYTTQILPINSITLKKK